VSFAKVSRQDKPEIRKKNANQQKSFGGTMAGQNGQNSISPFFPGFQGIVATERA
jgi:hypothetical protein